ncbi:MAG TPA: wax ester/triacylglycerol synthase family O-acyltransferase [Acidimicrobiales bacterium]|nr:wax ester/triacylglycerol synthase family O-acyltransferase [Acidimicrobiales bacterium]
MSPTIEALTALDSFFLYLESPKTPMHGGSVGIFEGAPLRDRLGRLPVEAARAEVERRLELVPRLRQRVQFSRLGAPPVWVDDPDFDIANHVLSTVLPSPGTETQLTELCAELMATLLDRERPLWEMWFVDGLDGGRVAVIEKLHHAMADGLAGVELATVLLDLQRHPDLPHQPTKPWLPGPAPSLGAMLAHDVIRRGAAPLHSVAHGLDAMRHPVQTARHAAELGTAVSAVVTPQSIAPSCSLNVPVGEGRQVLFVRQPLDDLKRAEHRFGVTINDLLLTAVAGGLHRLFSARGERVEGRTVQVLVPVGLDHHGDHRLGNKVAAMLVRLPIGTSDPADRLRAVAEAAQRSKQRHQALAAELIVDLLEPWPQPALSAVTQLVHKQPLVNLVVTNVPGPDIPLYAMGARMLEAFPIVPLAGNLSVGVAALSYDGQLTVGLLVDPVACPDAAVLAAGISRSFADLVAATSHRPRRRRIAGAAEESGHTEGARTRVTNVAVPGGGGTP